MCVCVCACVCVCECVCVCVQVMVAVSFAPDRYCTLPSLLHRVDFLNVQIHLLLEFHYDLALAVEREHSSPTTPCYLAYLNAAQYISTVLQQWGEEAVRHSPPAQLHAVSLYCLSLYEQVDALLLGAYSSSCTL